MTADRRTELEMPRILAELGAGPEPDYVDDVLARTAHAWQRPAWFYPSRWLPVDLGLGRIPTGYVPVRQLALVVLLLVAAAAAVALYAGNRHRVPPPFGPATNGLVAYGLNGDIYVADPITGHSTPISADPGHYDFAPSFSPDGTMVAFERRVDPGSDLAIDIVVAAADGSGARRITPAPFEEIPWVAKWTPDGASIAVVTSGRADSVVEFFDARGVRAPQVIHPGMQVDSLAFQPPDGRRILFRGQSGFEIGLFTMNRDGSDVAAVVEPYVPNIQLNKFVFEEWGPNCTVEICSAFAIHDLLDATWSPDGTKLVVRKWAFVDGEDRVQLVLMNADGADAHPIGYTAGDIMAADPAWSPDGSRIAFLRDQGGIFQFAVVKLADDIVTATGPPITDGMADVEWSPDGTQLLVTEHSGHQRLLLLDPDTGTARALPGVAEAPGWWSKQAIPNAADHGYWQRLTNP